MTMRRNKLEHFSLETLSSQVLEFEGKDRANPIEAPFRCFLLGMFTPNVRLDWKVIARYKHSSLFGLVISNGRKKFYNIDTRWSRFRTSSMRFSETSKRNPILKSHLHERHLRRKNAKQLLAKACLF
jgi:hypothetical protein